MKRPHLQIGLGLALGTGMGIAVAFIFGSRGLWLALGIAIGILIDTLLLRAPAKGEYQPATSDRWMEKRQ